jgi:hypothetical protein
MTWNGWPRMETVSPSPERPGKSACATSNPSTHDLAGGLVLGFIEQAPLAEIRRQDARVRGICAAGEDAAHAVTPGLDRGRPQVAEHGEVELRIRSGRDDPVQLDHVLGPEVGAVREGPPVLGAEPGPLVHVQHIVAQQGKAPVESDVDSSNRRAHERNGRDADDNSKGRQRGPHLVRPDLRHRNPDRLGEFVEKPAHAFAVQ